MNEIVEINIGWLIVIVILISLVIYVLYLKGRLHITRQNIAFLNSYVDSLEEERGKQSDQLRKKGIEIDELKKKIKSLKGND